jgi:hypothetical protein
MLQFALDAPQAFVSRQFLFVRTFTHELIDPSSPEQQHEQDYNEDYSYEPCPLRSVVAAAIAVEASEPSEQNDDD